MGNSIGLFPTPLGIYDIPKGILKKEDLAVEKELLSTQPNDGNLISTTRSILDNPELKRIKLFIQNSVQDYVVNVCDYKLPDLKLTQSWANLTNTGQFHHEHIHQNSLFSGSFYVRTTEEDIIQFHNSKVHEFSLNVEKQNPYNSDTWWMPATTGRLYIFPSNLKHSVPPVYHATTRVSISFNVFPNSPIGSVINSNYLPL
jgi:uncharacterized protein (TIGR02466 family)